MTFSTIFGAGSGSDMISYYAPLFFALFLPLTVILYAVTPNKWKRYCLLLASYVFYWLISGQMLAYLLATTVSMHYFGLWLDRVQTQMKTVLAETEKEDKKAVKKAYIAKQRAIVLFAVVLHIGALLVVKYTGFFMGNVNSLLALAKVPMVFDIPTYWMPIGVSFFTLQAVSYILDVYHGVTKADDNLFRLGLFISFFPQIVEGPICRYNETADSLWNAKPITYRNLTFGIQRFLFGMLKKIVIADRLNPLVQKLFMESSNSEGGVIAFAAVCYTVQLYCDFSGSMDAVLGTAQIFGIEMPENFQRPFFSKTISEFWKRWHITLGAWFRDYIFYPITTADKMKKLTSAARKKIGNHYGPLLAGSVALFCVWFCNGLWHGSAWSFVFFGMYHFVLILLGNVIAPVVKTVNQKLHIKSDCFLYRLFQMIRTAVLVVIGELFFRALNLTEGIKMFVKMVTNFSFTTWNTHLLEQSGLDYVECLVAAVTLLMVFAVSIINERGISVREVLAKKNIVLRWAVLLGLVLYIIVFGAFGISYDSVNPLYAQF